jgi:hypothetical protein
VFSIGIYFIHKLIIDGPKAAAQAAAQLPEAQGRRPLAVMAEGKPEAHSPEPLR